LLANGIKLFGYSDVKKSGVDSSILYKIKLASQEKIDSAFGPKSAAFIKAITLGDKSDMSPLDYSAYAKAGVSHMLVISGLHLSLIVFTLFSLLKGFGTNKYVTLFLCLCTDLFICFMTGFTPSVVRSSVMLLFLLVGKTFLLSYDSTTSLFTALLILIIFNPYCIASLGMELSFLSTFGILAVSSKIGSFDIHKHHILSKLTNTFLVPFIFSFVTFVFTLPVTFLRLDIISII
ncbi:MAG: ComEC/Rec2 family competence protein, partial [Clostridia bacterium]